MHVIVHEADIQDRDGGAMLMATMFGLYPFLLKLYADGGYQGASFQAAMKTIMAQVNVEIVKRSDQAKGFTVLPKRWATLPKVPRAAVRGMAVEGVERTFAWLNRCRRLVKDWECLNRKSRAFLLLASVRLMLRRLARSME
jgi:transposase